MGAPRQFIDEHAVCAILIDDFHRDRVGFEKSKTSCDQMKMTAMLCADCDARNSQVTLITRVRN